MFYMKSNHSYLHGTHVLEGRIFIINAEKVFSFRFFWIPNLLIHSNPNSGSKNSENQNNDAIL